MSISDSSTHCLHLALPFLPALGEAYGADGSEGEEGRQCSGTGADSGTGDGQWDSCERTALGEENQRNDWRRPSLIVLGTTTTHCR